MTVEEKAIIYELENMILDIAPYKWERDSFLQISMVEQGLIAPDRVYSTLCIHILSPAFQTILDIANQLSPYRGNAYNATERFILFDVTPKSEAA